MTEYDILGGQKYSYIFSARGFQRSQRRNVFRSRCLLVCIYLVCLALIKCLWQITTP